MTMPRRLVTALMATGVMVFTPAMPGLELSPVFRVPFPCGQAWSGWTRTNHRPPQAVDFNRPDDAGDTVVASAPGTVTVIDLAHDSYGVYVAIDHGGGWETRYAHLSSVAVTPDDRVAGGQVIGTVGSTGRSAGPHLHYEQRLRGRPTRVVFNARELPSQSIRRFVTPGC